MLDEDFDRETLMETFPGARTFPQIIVDGEKDKFYFVLDLYEL